MDPVLGLIQILVPTGPPDLETVVEGSLGCSVTDTWYRPPLLVVKGHTEQSISEKITNISSDFCSVYVKTVPQSEERLKHRCLQTLRPETPRYETH